LKGVRNGKRKSHFLVTNYTYLLDCLITTMVLTTFYIVYMIFPKNSNYYKLSVMHV